MQASFTIVLPERSYQEACFGSMKDSNTVRSRWRVSLDATSFEKKIRRYCTKHAEDKQKYNIWSGEQDIINSLGSVRYFRKTRDPVLGWFQFSHIIHAFFVYMLPSDRANNKFIIIENISTNEPKPNLSNTCFV